MDKVTNSGTTVERISTKPALRKGLEAILLVLKM